jgi:4-amino-4-deoxy-L-arabinose transferase-like glycosyltransferase
MAKLDNLTTTNWLVIAILAAHVILGVIYSVVTPLWESYDEWGHYPYVQYVATERALPTEPLVDMNDETHQPPLYYILGALATFGIDTSDSQELILNEHSVQWGGEGGIAQHLPLPSQQFPYRGTALAAHITRLVSVLLGTVAVWATYATTVILFPQKPEIALGALAISAFWPQLLFLGGVITNDIMIIACGSLTLLFLAKIFKHDIHILTLLGLGLSLGAGLLAKRNGLALIPFVAAGLVIVTIYKKERIKKRPLAFLGGSGLVLVGTALMATWWLDGLITVYHRHIARIFSILSDPAAIAQLHWDRLLSGLYFCLATFFAAFGNLLLGVEPWIYALVAAICLAAFLGTALFLVNKQTDRTAKLGVTILLLHLLAFLAAPAYRTLIMGEIGPTLTILHSIQAESPLVFEKAIFLFQGRFVLPAISSFSILLVLGLTSLVPNRFSQKVILGLATALFLFAVMAPFRYIQPAYAKPQLLSPDQVQTLERPLHIYFDDKIELLGYELETKAVTAGDSVPVTLYWHSLKEMGQNYSLKIEVLGPEAQVYGVLRLHPGHGNFPTSLWQKGDVFRETYHISTFPDVPAPSLAYINVSFENFAVPAWPQLRPHDGQGQPISPGFGRLAIRPSTQPVVKNPTYYQLGEQIALVGSHIVYANEVENIVEITLYWQALTAVQEDFTTFVHVVDEHEQLVAQHDSQPRGGLAPTTIWQEGDIIEDKFSLLLPEDAIEKQYEVRVGMYKLTTMERLPAFDADSYRQPHDMIVLQ